MIDGPRFWSHVSFLDDSADACWIWVGSITDDGRYGRFFTSHRNEVRAHRAAWEIRNGPIPKGYMLKQECPRPQCVRHWKLSGKHKKLTKRARAEIIASNLGLSILAKKYNVTRQYVRELCRTSLQRHTKRAESLIA